MSAATLAVAGLAAYLPARRAARIEPTRALRIGVDLSGLLGP